MRHALKCISLLVLLIGAGPIAEGQIRFPGKIHTPPDFRLHVGQGFDTMVGWIGNSSGVRINYDIGPLAGNITRNDRPNDWIEGEYSRRQTRSGNHAITIVFTRVSARVQKAMKGRSYVYDPNLKEILISFTDVCANFHAEFQKEEEARVIEKIVLSFTPDPDISCGGSSLPAR